MGISKQKQIRMLDFTFEEALEKKYPFLSRSVVREIATLAALNFNHEKYRKTMIRMHHEKKDLEETLTRKKQRLREYEDAIIRRNEEIRELKFEDNPVVYRNEFKTKILYQGTYKNHKFCICNLGHHPTAYVENKLKDVYEYDDPRIENVDVHYGFTYIGHNYWDHKDELEYLGWDYSHYGDYLGSGFFKDGKKWTTKEIYEEVVKVIDQLIKIEKEDQST